MPCSDEDKIPSLGIVAVNLQQRELIREEFNRLRTDDPLVDLYLDKVLSKGEEFFVKNLENVQGDERDFIFISMTYGREPGGYRNEAAVRAHQPQARPPAVERAVFPRKDADRIVHLLRIDRRRSFDRKL